MLINTVEGSPTKSYIAYKMSDVAGDPQGYGP